MHTTKTYLRIKILSLQAEAKLIRREEARWIIKGRRDHPIRLGLKAHRKWDVRREQRASLLAYGFLRGRKYKQIEAKCHTPPNWVRVADLVAKYGGTGTGNKERLAVLDQLRAWYGN